MANCPQALPPAATIEGFVATLGNNLSSTIAPLGLVGPETKCASAENIGCAVGNVGNSAAIEAIADQFVTPDIVGSIPPP